MGVTTPDIEKLKAAVNRLDCALMQGTMRYSRDRGEPEPTKAFPYELAFTVAQWHEVEAARLEILNALA